ncbi:uncharacterized protein LOC118435572 [Folsomia candida]|uniref:uncharacterized protein LOC118435572 n=1 Tax=Folsomia candida TaxID=158441 RepID=UPI0016054994|nr:uncharacterized protein LOC118435572 [Folsomia candida]
MENSNNFYNCIITLSHFFSKLDSYTPSCAAPVSLLESGLYVPIAPLDDDYKLPYWFNSTLWNIGQKFAQKNIFSVFLSPIAGASMFITNKLKEPVVIGTGKSGTPHTSNVRYLATMLQMKSWFEQGVKASSKGQISDHIIKSLTKVRRIHRAVNRLNASMLYGDSPPYLDPHNTEAFTYDAAMWDAFQKDMDASNVPQQYRDYPDHVKYYSPKTAGPTMNQLLFSLVQWACGSIPILMPERFGISDATEEDLLGYMHLWAVLGNGLGIEDRYNVGLQPSLSAAKKHYQDIFNIYFLPTLFQAKPDGQRMLEHFYRGFVRNLLGQTGDSIISVHQILLLSIEDTIGIPCPRVKAQLGIVQRAFRVPLSYVTQALGRQTPRTIINELIKRRYFISGAKRFLNLNANDPAEIAEKSYYF